MLCRKVGQITLFSNEGDHSQSKATGYAWSEKTGSYHFAKAIAAEKKISTKKATKMFMERSPENYAKYVKEQEKELTRVINKQQMISLKKLAMIHSKVAQLMKFKFSVVPHVPNSLQRSSKRQQAARTSCTNSTQVKQLQRVLYTWQ